MKHLLSSFQQHQGLRGAHVYSEDECHFMAWNELVSFVNMLPSDIDPKFGEKLLETVSNYNPDQEFLAVRQFEDSASIELYALN